MRNVRRMALATGFTVALGSVAAIAAGKFSTLPVVGGNSFCASTVTGTGGLGGITGQGQGSTGSICGQTVPAGPPAITGTELIPADTQLANGASPQTVQIPSALMGSINAKANRLNGGDFATNLWQRGTSFASITPTTATLTADRWYTYSSANTVTVNKQTGAADSIPSIGLYASLRAVRPTGSDVTPICVGQVLDKEAAQALVGNNGVFSFYGLAGAGFSAANKNLSVNVAYYTAADSATPGTNTGTFATGAITGYQSAVAGVSPGTTGSVANGVASIPISTTWTRYSVYAPIPATNASGTAVTGAGISICDTPVGTGGATDWFEVEGAQLQALPSAVSNNLPNGVIAPTGFERIPASVEADRELAYSYVLTDGAATQRYANGFAESTALAGIYLNFPEQMRETPALTVGTTISFAVAFGTASTQACGTSIAGVASSFTVGGAALLCTTGATALTAGNGLQFIGANTGGLLTFSAEP